jgi:alpha-glucosidase
MAFTVGADLLVAASPHPDSPQAYDICLPAKGWYDYWTGKRVASEKVSETPRLDRLPVFVRAGAIIPKQPLVESTSETPRGPLRLEVYPGDDCRGTIYLDDGTSIDGPSLRQEVRCTVVDGGVSLSFGERQGSYKPWWKSISVTVHGARPLTRLIPDQPHAATVHIP